MPYVDTTRCRANVLNGGRSVNYRCVRKSWKDGYCRQHHPDAVAERDAARISKWNAENKAASNAVRKQKCVSAAERAVIQAAEEWRWSMGHDKSTNALQEAIDALLAARGKDAGRYAAD